MTEVQKIFCQLLNEIDIICTENNLDYFLDPKTALQAYRSEKFEVPCSALTVFMPLDHILKFRECFFAKKPIDREFDSIFDNDFFPNLSFRYAHSNSLYLNLNESADVGLKTHGIFIRISVLRTPQKGLKQALFRALEIGWIYCNPHYHTNKFKRKILKKLGEILISLNRPLYKKFLIALFKSTQKGLHYDKKLHTTAMFGKATHFQSGMFAQKARIKLEDNFYCVPNDLENYFQSAYKKNWSERRFSNTSANANIFLSSRLPYKVFFQQYGEAELSSVFADDLRLEKKLRAKVRASNLSVNKAWHYVLRTGARFKMWEKYMPVKEEIKQLYHDQNWDELRKILNDYDTVTKEFKQYKMTVFFDREIFDIYKALLIHDEDLKLAEKIEQRIPECHLVPINIKPH